MHRHHAIDYIEFTVSDLARAWRFYAEAFGWRFTECGPGCLGNQGDDGEVAGRVGQGGAKGRAARGGTGRSAELAGRLNGDPGCGDPGCDDPAGQALACHDPALAFVPPVPACMVPTALRPS